MPLELSTRPQNELSLQWDELLWEYVAGLDALYASDLHDFIEEGKMLGLITLEDKIFWQPHLRDEDERVLLAALREVLWRCVMHKWGLDERGYPLRDEVLEAEEVTRR